MQQLLYDFQQLPYPQKVGVIIIFAIAISALLGVGLALLEFLLNRWFPDAEKEKRIKSKPMPSLNFAVYDNTGKIKQGGRELRRRTYEVRKNEERRGEKKTPEASNESM
jgi:hypothetical protein